jgi:hypothetical protein
VRIIEVVFDDSKHNKGATSMVHRFFITILALIAALTLAACGGGSSSTAQPTNAPGASNTTTEPTAAPASDGEAKLVKAVFAKALNENQAPVDETESFAPDETVYFSMEFEGRPKEGTIEAAFFFRDDEIAKAEVDFADTNSGVLFSFGESTFAGFNLSHTEPLPISENYRVEATLNGKKLADYPFKVVAPEGSTPSEIKEVVLARGATDSYEPVDPTTEFAPDETVFLVGSADLGKLSWVQADWYVDGKLDEAGTRSLTMQEDISAGGFAFSFLPEGGWPVGEHEVALTLNDKEVERLSFTIADGAAAEPTSDPAAGANTDGEWTSYTSSDGVFSIEVPTSWQQNDSSQDGAIATIWFNNEQASGVFVLIKSVEGETSSEELATQVQDYVQSTFGTDPDFEMSEVEAQADGSQRIVWSSAPDFGSGTPTPINGLTFIEQRGDKLSLLTLVAPQEGFDSMSELIDRVLNSYKIDPEATIQ